MGRVNWELIGVWIRVIVLTVVAWYTAMDIGRIVVRLAGWLLGAGCGG
jgi:hypothetical protein